MRNACSILGGKTEGKRPLRNSVKVSLKVIGCEGMDWIHLAQDKVQWRNLLHMAMNLQVPNNTENFINS
jgi:hypothetical protein